ncbi:protein fantom isoform X3 [Gouania willdenowi]|uniref:protein fantom isoform X3 n=1 Tax=Gouania willdenowi TaxID=441366 RepID=UPI001055F1D9|nr:protein fantom-like isoform X3 [Gouania willdenowi]
MSPVVDETSGDLPVRDVGLMRGGLMPSAPDTVRYVKSWKKHHIMKSKADPQRVFRFPREHLEDLCLRLQEENSVLKQHTRTQENRLRRMSARLLRIRQAPPGPSGMKDRDMEDTIQELEARVVMLESQKGMLQNKLSLAKQHIMDLGIRTPHRLSKGKSLEVEGGARRAAQTAPPRYGHMLDDTRAEMERLSNMAEQVRMAELELTTQALRDTLREKEKEMEGTVIEMKKHQAERHRITIRENVDLIRLKKQLSDKSAALRVSQEKFTDLQKAYESQLEESQRSLRESQAALLEKVEELTEQLKQERQRSLDLGGQIGTTALSLQTMDKLQDRMSDLEGERDLIKDNYNALLERTLSAQSSQERQLEKHRDVESKREDVRTQMEICRLEEMLQAEREERAKVDAEKEKLEQKLEKLEEHKTLERQFNGWVTDKEQQLEQEVLQYREQVSVLQDRLDSVTKEFDMSVEDLSETLLQIKAFRMQQESIEGLRFLSAEGRLDDPTRELVNIQASHAEIVLELKKTRNLLLMEHQITKDLQDELYTIKTKAEKEKQENQKKITDKDKLLSKRGMQINTLQAQLKELAYNPRSYKRTIPTQYTWPAGNEEVVQPIEDDMSFSQLRAGESLLEIHLKSAAFTPTGLHIMGRICSGHDREENIVTFFTYSLLDFEDHSTPLVSGSQPNYGFTSRYALTARDLGRLGGQGSRVRVELHQALGGVRFVTHGSGHMILRSAMESRGERMGGHVNITGPEGEIVGVLDFWVRLFPPAEPLNTILGNGSHLGTSRGPVQMLLGWDNSGNEKLHDYGAGIPNELLIMLERCVGLNTRWPGLFPDAYLTYQFHDLPPHVSQTVQCSADPVFNDATSYPLAVTTDVLHYLRSRSLWVYVYDDSDDQVPQTYLAKTPIPLRALATGKEIRGDYVLRDAAGGPRGMVRVMIKWKYPFQPVGNLMGQVDEQDGALEGLEREVRRVEDGKSSSRPIAKPRLKMQQPEPKEIKTVQRGTNDWALPSPVKQKSFQDSRSKGTTYVKPREPHPSTERKRLTKRSPKSEKVKTPEPRMSTKSLEGQSPTTPSRRSSASDDRSQDVFSLENVSTIEDLEEDIDVDDSEASKFSDSSSSQDDVVIISPIRKPKKGEKLIVEILSLTFEPNSHVAMNESVQQVFVEYRLLGVPMETTETPMSLRKPMEGEEIHYNFTRVIYVDGSHSAPLRQYLYTMLEGADPNQGRLKFTVVSEPMDDDDECVDVGHAFLNLKELLLSGNDVIKQQIDILSLDEGREVIGNLKVSLEAAKALSGIYQEFHQEESTEEKDETEEEEEEEDEEDESEEEVSREEKNKDPMQVIDYDSDVF